MNICINSFHMDTYVYRGCLSAGSLYTGPRTAQTIETIYDPTLQHKAVAARRPHEEELRLCAVLGRLRGGKVVSGRRGV